MNLVTPPKPQGAPAYSCQYHVAWCPKFGRPVLKEPLASRLEALILGKQEAFGYRVLDIRITPAFVHLVLDATPKAGDIGMLVSRMKHHTAHVLRQEYPWLRSRLPSLWTRRHFISTAGIVSLDDVQAFIDAQRGV